MSGAVTAVLFVCTGNICRSPTAEGVFRELVRAAGLAERIAVDSAGTIDYHAGDPPDPRAVAAARRRGYDLSDLRAREVERADFERFELVIAMDRGHRRELRALAPPGREDRVRLFLEFGRGARESDVPDPYYGGPAGFELVLDLVEDAARGLLEHLRSRLGDGAA